jgi:hypothetical protein
MKAEELAFKTQQLTQKLRRTPMPLADLIPHLQEMADELRRLDALEQAAEPVAAEQRFRNPQKGTPDWSVWQPAMVSKIRPAWEIDSLGYEVEYRLLYTHPAPRKPMTEEDVRKWQGDHDVVMSIKAYRSLLKLVGVERFHKIKE